jgi:hypothetical protein
MPMRSGAVRDPVNSWDTPKACADSALPMLPLLVMSRKIVPPVSSPYQCKPHAFFPKPLSIAQNFAKYWDWHCFSHSERKSDRKQGGQALSRPRRGRERRYNVARAAAPEDWAPALRPAKVENCWVTFCAPQCGQTISGCWLPRTSFSKVFPHFEQVYSEMGMLVLDPSLHQGWRRFCRAFGDGAGPSREPGR